MQVQKLKAAMYAIGKRMQGYQLLKNPKGTPATSVKVMEHLEYINDSTLDISGFYHSITKDFSKTKTDTTTQYLFFNNYAFYNKSTKNIDRKKHLDLFKKMEISGETTYKNKIKGHIPYEELESRDTAPLQKVTRRVKERYIDFSTAFLGVCTEKERTSSQTYAELAVDKYHKTNMKKREKKFAKQGFWKTLFQNLMQ